MRQPNETGSHIAFIVFGRVQGVGFRWWVRRTAQSLGVRGTVRNLPDGSVEVQAAGSLDALHAFRDSLAVGPAAARVDGLRPVSPAPALPPDFRILA